MSENHWSKLQRDAAHILDSAKGRKFLTPRCTLVGAQPWRGQPWRGQLVGNLGGNPGKGNPGGGNPGGGNPGGGNPGGNPSTCL